MTKSRGNVMPITKDSYMSVQEAIELQWAKKDLALQIQAMLLMARVKIMAEEIFPAHRVMAQDVKQGVTI